MNGPLTILHVSEPGVDGVFTIVERLADQMLARGHKIHLAYSTRRGSPALTALVQRVVQAGGQTLDLNVGNAPTPRDALALFRLWRFARRVRPQIIHAHSSKAGVLGRALAWLGIDARFFYSPHAYYGLVATAGRKTALFNAIERVFGGVGTTIACSTDEKRFAVSTLKLPDKTIRLLFHSVDCNRFKPPDSASRSATRLAFGIADSATVIGTLGRVCFQKDPQTLYHAVAQAMSRRPELHLLHVGRGELNEEIAQLAGQLGLGSRITRLAFLAEPEKFYAACDAFILPSRYEGLPISAIEALASDLPVIFSRGPGFADFLNLGLSHCWTAKAEDAEGFAQAIEAWLDDRATGRQINHRALASEHFDTNRCVDRMLAIYQGAPLPSEEAL